jgi:uncharacterized protein YkwD
MKKNIIATILSATLIATLALSGCGNTSDVGATETVALSTEEAVAVEGDATEEAFVEGETLSEESTEDVESTEVEDTEGENESTETIASASYTYTDMSKTMYAKSSVNVRDLPSTDGNKLGGLSTNEEVTVTGQCNETSWYRIEYKGSTGYVSNKYLSDEKVATTSTGSGAGSTGSTGATASAGTDVGAVASTGGTVSTDTSNGLLDKSMGQAILAKINAERSAAGTAQMIWDETLYSYACQRAQAIVSNFSHAGATYAENIAFSGKTSPTADNIHTQFYNSSAHREAYMNSRRTNCAVAVYYYNGVWYAVEAFSGDGYSYSCDVNGNWSVTPSSSNSSSSSTDTSSGQTTAPSSNSWTASNGVTVYDMGNGMLAAGGGYTGTQEEWNAAVAEYYATH